ncbi:unnamed protein product, partial [Amoebophrya sp. A25]|eukprot:GSA25T00004229001.1
MLASTYGSVVLPADQPAAPNPSLAAGDQVSGRVTHESRGGAALAKHALSNTSVLSNLHQSNCVSGGNDTTTMGDPRSTTGVVGQPG